MKYEPGIYLGKLVDSHCGELPSDKRTPFISLIFEITHYAENGQWVETLQQDTRAVMLFLTDRAWPYTKDKLDALGFNGDFANPDFGKQAKEGVNLECKDDPKDGKVYEKWDLHGFNSAQEHKPLDVEKLRVFNARYRSETSNAATPGGAPPAAPVSQPATTAPAEPAVPATQPAAAQPSTTLAAPALDDDCPF